RASWSAAASRAWRGCAPCGGRRRCPGACSRRGWWGRRGWGTAGRRWGGRGRPTPPTPSRGAGSTRTPRAPPPACRPLGPPPAPPFNTEGAFKAPPEYTWSLAADEELNERLTRLLEERARQE